MTIASFKSFITTQCALGEMNEDMKDKLLWYIEEKIEGRQPQARTERRSFADMVRGQRGVLAR